MEEKKYIKLSAIAQELNIDRTTIYKWIEKGYLKTKRFPSGTIRVERNDYQTFLNSDESGRTTKVLIIDDQKIVLDILKVLLESITSLALDVRTCEDGLTGLLEVGKFCPDIVIMDYNLGDVNGITLARRIFSFPQFSEIPVIMISGVIDSLSVEAPCGNVKAFLRKPVSVSSLEQAIHDCLPGVHSAVPQ